MQQPDPLVPAVNIEPPLDEAPFQAQAPQPPREPFWGYLDLALVIGLLAGFLVILILITTAMAFVVPSLQHDQTPAALPFQIAVYVCVYFCFYLTFKFRYNRPVFASLGWRKTNVNLVAAAFGGVLLAFGLSALAALLHTPKVETPFDKLAGTPFSLFLLTITAVLFAPLFEEMFFRGFLQPLLSRSLGVPAGVLLTALLFGGLHSAEYLNAWQYVAAITVVGIVLGTVRARTNSIVPGAVMHGCFNLVSMCALIFSKYSPHQ